MESPIGIYVSVPFCKAKCTFCNFASGAFGTQKMQTYVDRVCTEIRASRTDAANLGAPLPMSADTVYFGGGTPSLLSAMQMRELFTTLRSEFTISASAEITLECAPGQLDGETLDELLRQGMNRVSFGVQSFVDHEAAATGRLHTRAMCLAEIDRLRAASVRDINVDLIVGLPHQTAQSWRESVEVAIASRVPHVSVYMLEVDEESRLGREMGASGSRYGAAEVPSEDDAAAWYSAACEWLEGAEIRQYEISNFAQEGHASRHNVKYWRREPYVGFGLDAHSMLRHGNDTIRRANTQDLDKYLGHGSAISCKGLETLGLRVFDAKVETTVERIGKHEAFEEAMFLGLRMKEGVELDRLRTEFGDTLVASAMEAMGEVEEAGLVHRTGGRLLLTGAGRMVSNEVFSRLLVADPA